MVSNQARPWSGKPPATKRATSAGGKPSRPRSATAAKPKVVKPDLIEALKTSGLQQYVRKLEDMGLVGVVQIVKMGRAQVDELIELLRPLPGHQMRLLNLFEEQRTRHALAARSHAAAASWWRWHARQQ